MTSFLDDIKKGIAKGFPKGKLRTGLILENQPASQDDYGDVAPPSDPITHSFSGIRVNFDAAWMVRAEIPTTDVSILIIEGTVQDGYATLQDDLVQIDGFWHKVRRILKIDPAGATRELQAYVVDAPTNLPTS